MNTEQQQYVRKWLHSIFNGGDKDISKQDVQADIEWLYKSAKLQVPTHIVISNSYKAHQQAQRKFKIKVHPATVNAIAIVVFDCIDEIAKNHSQIFGSLSIEELGIHHNVFRDETDRVINRIIPREETGEETGEEDSKCKQYFGLAHDLWIGCYAKYIDDGTITAENSPNLSKLYSFLTKGIFDIQFYPDHVFICKMPTKLCRDERGAPHSIDEAAIQWHGHENDAYFINGVSFPRDLWEKVVRGQLSCKEILALQNIEQKHISLRLYGPEKLLADSNALLVSKGNPRHIKNYHMAHYEDININTEHVCDGRCKLELKTITNPPNELYEIDGLIEYRTLKLLKYTCPSTGRIYCSFVPYHTNTADEGMAWKLRLSNEEYKAMEVEA